MDGARVKVLIIDDSAYNRRVLRRMLESEPSIEVVESARDGEEGLKKALDLSPDVVTLDLEMPKMDGFTFLRILMNRRPTPVIVVSGKADSQTTFLAMELGAIDFVAKPQNQISPDLYGIHSELVKKILGARMVSMDKVCRLTRREVPRSAEAVAPLSTGARREGRIVVVGASTGGPTALQTVLSRLPGDLPAPVLVAQHMPAGFTKAFAERVNKVCTLEVRETENLVLPRAGQVLITPGGFHARVSGTRERPFVKLERTGPGDRYVPSVDRLFQSAAEVFGAEAVGVVLTGMGDDGRHGVMEIRRLGGQTLAESEETAVIFGMPREAIQSGAIDAQAPVERLAGEIVVRCRRAGESSTVPGAERRASGS
ncbi:MAG: chemotaxis response regulator protein-glutamate methylesterase [Nitrospirae bacterium]|nr:chemotaxis response regulator protein-glutamate methylesterase [Nitrospirota bacterium]